MSRCCSSAVLRTVRSTEAIPLIDDRLPPMDNTEGHYQSLKLKNSFREDAVLGSQAARVLGPPYAWGSK